MASLNVFLAPTAAISTNTITTSRTRRVQTFATVEKGSCGSSEEKGFFEWLAGALDKEGLLETDPVLQKVEGKSGGTTTITGKKTTTSAAPPKKTEGNDGFGGLGVLFAKK